MQAPDGRATQRINISMIGLVVLGLGMVPLFADGVSGNTLHREKVDDHTLLRTRGQQSQRSNGAGGRTLQADGLCRNGIPGVTSSDGTGKICCVAECGVCGGVDCSTNAEEAGLSADECCVSAITSQGNMCAVTNSAPCIIESGDEAEGAPLSMPGYNLHGCFKMGDGEDPFFYDNSFDDLTLSLCESTCAGQQALYFGVHEGKFCSCGDTTSVLESSDYQDGTCDVPCAGDADETCGGDDSYSLYAFPVEEGSSSSSSDDSSSDDSSSDDSSSDDSSSDDVHSSSIFMVDGELPTCSDGIVGVESESGDVCCGYRCGTCGGDRCVGWGDCCEETIQAEEELCSVTNAAPCVFKKVAPAPTPVPEVIAPTGPREIPQCTGGIPGVESEDGAICCWEGCGECEGLSTMETGCVGVYDCCESKILEDGVPCSDVDAGPCVL